ncbi:hypothetical protein CRG98_043011 [Punica granatum]|uniref:Uncharacterized protein n=1 Tax=Punica granatum TaxID=22663 RepID=A0A2I0HY19_PUNGR|nr:hypothetical protein CRG98_043011 [Punica granatum]
MGGKSLGVTAQDIDSKSRGLVFDHDQWDLFSSVGGVSHQVRMTRRRERRSIEDKKTQLMKFAVIKYQMCHGNFNRDHAAKVLRQELQCASRMGFMWHPLHLNQDPEKFVHEYYSMETWRKVYEPFIVPVRGEGQWEETGQEAVLPLAYFRGGGRPKKKRNKSKDGPKNPYKAKRVVKGKGIETRAGNQNATVAGSSGVSMAPSASSDLVALPTIAEGSKPTTVTNLPGKTKGRKRKITNPSMVLQIQCHMGQLHQYHQAQQLQRKRERKNGVDITTSPQFSYLEIPPLPSPSQPTVRVRSTQYHSNGEEYQAVVVHIAGLRGTLFDVLDSITERTWDLWVYRRAWEHGVVPTAGSTTSFQGQGGMASFGGSG